ncbi:hypothetical protein V8D89_002030 [Ganoderma adspersum]
MLISLLSFVHWPRKASYHALADPAYNRNRSAPSGTGLLWEKLPTLGVLKFTPFNFISGMHQLFPLAYLLPNLEELVVVGFTAACPPYRDSVVELDVPPSPSGLPPPMAGWRRRSWKMEALAKLLFEPRIHPPLEILDLWNDIVASFGLTPRRGTIEVSARGDHANLPDHCGSLRQCTHLESFATVVCDMYPSDAPDYHPFRFLDMLADLFASGPHPPSRQFESLELEMVRHKERMLERCAKACAQLASALEDRTRYLAIPVFQASGCMRAARR